jgi:hypothetical protein
MDFDNLILIFLILISRMLHSCIHNFAAYGWGEDVAGAFERNCRALIAEGVTADWAGAFLRKYTPFG